MVRVLDKDQVGADHGIRERGANGLDRAAGGGVGGPDDSAGADDGRAANVEGCQVEVCDAVSGEGRSVLGMDVVVGMCVDLLACSWGGSVWNLLFDTWTMKRDQKDEGNEGGVLLTRH